MSLPHSPSLRGFLFTGVIVWLALAFVFLFVAMCSSVSDNEHTVIETLGQMGDSFGALNALLSIFVACAAYMAYSKQKEEIDMLKAEGQQALRRERYLSHPRFGCRVDCNPKVLNPEYTIAFFNQSGVEVYDVRVRCEIEGTKVPDETKYALKLGPPNESNPSNVPEMRWRFPASQEIKEAKLTVEYINKIGELHKIELVLEIEMPTDGNPNQHCMTSLSLLSHSISIDRPLDHPGLHDVPYHRISIPYNAPSAWAHHRKK